MTGRKKISILIASLTVLVVVLVATLVIVLVAQQQNAKALISVRCEILIKDVQMNELLEKYFNKEK